MITKLILISEININVSITRISYIVFLIINLGEYFNFIVTTSLTWLYMSFDILATVKLEIPKNITSRCRYKLF